MSAMTPRASDSEAQAHTDDDTIVVFNRKSVDEIRGEGGCGYWPVGRDTDSLHSKGIRYVLCIRNRPDEVGHGEPYFVATLAERHVLRPGRVDDPNLKRRQLLKLVDWAPVDSRNKWRVKQNFEYGRLETFGIDTRSLSLHPFVATNPDEHNDADFGEPHLTGDAGPGGGGVKSAAVWSAQHSPLWEKIVGHLKGLVAVDGAPWRPDILCESQDESLLLTEVKPNCDTHNIITAIGQLTAYSTKLERVTKVIAAPGAKLIKSHLADAIEAQGVRLLDLDGNLQQQVRDLLSIDSRR